MVIGVLDIMNDFKGEGSLNRKGSRDGCLDVSREQGESELEWRSGGVNLQDVEQDRINHSEERLMRKHVL